MCGAGANIWWGLEFDIAIGLGPCKPSPAFPALLKKQEGALPSGITARLAACMLKCVKQALAACYFTCLPLLLRSSPSRWSAF